MSVSSVLSAAFDVELFSFESSLVTESCSSALVVSGVFCITLDSSTSLEIKVGISRTLVNCGDIVELSINSSLVEENVSLVLVISGSSSENVEESWESIDVMVEMSICVNISEDDDSMLSIEAAEVVWKISVATGTVSTSLTEDI